MTCSTCAPKKQPNARRVSSPVGNTEESDCDYNSGTTNAWLEKLICIQEKDLLHNFDIQKALYNSFLGILISIQRKPTTVCYFKKELDIIQPYILNIINENVC